MTSFHPSAVQRGRNPEVAPRAMRGILLQRVLAALGAALSFSALMLAQQRIDQATPAAPHRGVMQNPFVFDGAPARWREPTVQFVANRGQWDPRVRYRTVSGAMTTFVEERSITMDLHRNTPNGRQGVVVRLVFENAGAPRIVEHERLSGVYHFLRGTDASLSPANVPSFAELEHRDLYPGVGMRLMDARGFLRYDLSFAPEAAVESVVVRVEGAERLALAADGSLVMHTEFVDLVQSAPRSFQGVGGDVTPVASRFHLLGGNRYSFVVPQRATGKPLVIDPVIRWSTFIGGTKDDNSVVVRRTESGTVTIAGRTASVDYPITAGVYAAKHQGGAWDAMISRFDPAKRSSEQLVWSTFLGGDGDEAILDIVPAPDGGVLYAGYTDSSSFPVTPSDNRLPLGLEDAVIGHLDASGAKLVFGTRYGGAANDWANNVRADATGKLLTACGYSDSADLKTVAALQPKNAGMRDGFFVRIDTARTAGTQTTWSSYLGGSYIEGAYDASPWNRQDMSLHVDPTGVITVATQTDSNDFPTTSGAYQQKFAGNPSETSHITVSRIDPLQTGAKQLVWSTYVGGGTKDGWDVPYGMVVDDDGAIVIGGITYDPTFPTTPGAFCRTMSPALGPNAGHDGILLRLSGDGSKLLYSTLLGATGSASTGDMDVEPSGAILAAGFTFGSVPVTRGAVFPRRLSEGPPDAFVVRLMPNGGGRRDLLFGSYFGGSGGEACLGLVQDGSGGAYLTGVAQSADFPTSGNAFQLVNNAGPRDAWVAHFDLLPLGVERIGAASPACSDAFLGTRHWASRLDNDFALTVTGAPSNGAGIVVFGPELANPITVFGTTFYVDLLVGVTVVAGRRGELELPLPIPAGTAIATEIAMQSIWWGAAQCGPLPGSDALKVRIQP